MLKKIIDWFSKNDEDTQLYLPENESITFVLYLESLEIGTLSTNSGVWHFQYSESFKKQNTFNSIPGFPDLNKIYKSELLWPFFKTRIPGLGQPKVKAILNKEHIDEKNESALLKRFGRKTIANPYILTHS